MEPYDVSNILVYPLFPNFGCFFLPTRTLHIWNMYILHLVKQIMVM